MTTLAPVNIPSTALPPATPLTPNTSASSTSGLSFGDLVDALNPLQHIPVVSNLYRAATGAQISTASQLAGDTLYGAIAGSAAVSFATSLANVAVKQVTGEDIGQHVVNTLASVTGTATTAATTAAANANIPVTIAAASANITPLVPNDVVPQVSSLAASHINDPAAQAAHAARLIFHADGHSTAHTNAQYQRAQAYDSMHKKLLGVV